MPNFKPKNVKKFAPDKKSESLDCKHEQFLKGFQEEKNILGRDTNYFLREFFRKI